MAGLKNKHAMTDVNELHTYHHRVVLQQTLSTSVHDHCTLGANQLLEQNAVTTELFCMCVCVCVCIYLFIMVTMISRILFDKTHRNGESC
jgi:hypothetical protein